MKNLVPENLLSPYDITFKNIKANAYSRTIKEESVRYGKDVLLNVYRDMLYVREFENTLKKARVESRLGYKFSYPAHLSIGQEAVAVGMALAMEKEDVIFGTHRSHGEFIAKSLSAIRRSTDEELNNLLNSYPTPTYSAIKDKILGSTKDKATLFILYGAFCEIFARTTGLERGIGGSMHLHFIPFGSYPNNGIVGGSAPLAVGSALYDRVNGNSRLTIASVGDGALNCGAVYESIAFASMNQFKGLWKEKKGLPLLFVVTDNLYARGGNTKLETGSYDNPARLGAGFTSDQMHAESVNGLNPLAVADSIFRHRKDALDGKGASLINCTTYRHDEHSIGDALNRDVEEVKSWTKLDPIKAYPCMLLENRVITKEEIENVQREVESNIALAYSLAIDENISPVVNLKDDENYVNKHTFNGEKVAQTSGLALIKESDAYKVLVNKDASSFTIRDAISLGILEGYAHYPTFISYGEDVRGWQSKNSVFYGFDDVLPYEKLFNTPIAESAIVGAEIGYAMRGGNVLAELLYADFLTRASDEIINQASKWQTLSGGTIKLPLTLRLPIGRSYGGQHSQDLSGLIARVNGLKVYYPTTPSDTLAVMRDAIASCDPTIIFEPKEFYAKTELDSNDPRKVKAVEPTRLISSGKDATIVTLGPTLYDVLSLKKDSAKDLEIFSLVSLAPIDYAPIIDSLKKTKKLIIVGESSIDSGIMTNVVAKLQKECFGFLRCPIEIVSTPPTIVPPNGTESGYYNVKERLLSLL